MSIIICEIKPGIDPTQTNLITHPNEYWLADPANCACLTHYDGAITGNFWKVTGTSLELNDSGSTSSCWELDGTTLQLKA